ncbi:hypothetical protein [Selenomonas noxia]|uniref:hypothetical protein n=1 Tax=Selenomonas noxia TaxID=135083 RepID=UPI00248AA821|nr:hypothetical protein [Selenomonas noxia]
MEYLVIVAIVVIISLLDDRLRGKKKVPPPTVPQEIPRPTKRREKSGTFEIPPMRGIPGDVQVSADMEGLHEQELRVQWEEARRETERQRRLLQRRHEERPVQEEQPAMMPAAPRTAAALLPQLTPDTMKQAIVLSEVLGRPRALRRFPRR